MDNYTTAMAAFQPQLKALKLPFTKEQLGTKKVRFSGLSCCWRWPYSLTQCEGTHEEIHDIYGHFNWDGTKKEDKNQDGLTTRRLSPIEVMLLYCCMQASWLHRLFISDGLWFSYPTVHRLHPQQTVLQWIANLGNSLLWTDSMLSILDLWPFG